MKNTIKKITYLIVLLLAFSNCQDDDQTFGAILAPTDFEVSVAIQGQDTDNPDGDGSGFVTFTTSAKNAISYEYIFEDGTSNSTSSNTYQKRFTSTGVNTYEVTVVAKGTGGLSSSKTLNVTVLSTFSDVEAVGFLTGGSTKKWYFAAFEPAHLGVGPNNADAANNFWPNYYGAVPFEKAASAESSCLYDNELTFYLENDILKYELNNGGSTFFNAAFESVGGGSAGYDFCYNFDTTGQKTVSLAPSNSLAVQNGVPGQMRGTEMQFSDNGFMGYYVGQSTYEIISISNDRLAVRFVAGNDPALAWYHIFTTTPYVDQVAGNGPDEYTDLVWFDEFDTDGAPDPTKWTYDIGAGGWGNGEFQYYTNSSSNSVVSNGTLKITAKAEDLNGSSYTSARLKTEGLYDFTYGKVEVRAKLPSGGGTWPAIWMLGSNFSTVGWPACGEIDIMEHKGNEPNIIHGTLHYPDNSAGNGVTDNITISNASSEFHLYSVEWSPNQIKFFVDDIPFHTFTNTSTTPFNADFFMILNVAMGGTFGGAIDPAFVESAMEVDYVRVYQ